MVSNASTGDCRRDTDAATEADGGASLDHYGGPSAKSVEGIKSRQKLVQKAANNGLHTMPSEHEEHRKAKYDELLESVEKCNSDHANSTTQ